MDPTRRLLGTLLVLGLLFTTPLVPLALAAEGDPAAADPAYAADWQAVKAHLADGNVAEARAIYTDTFQAPFLAAGPEGQALDDRILAAFADAGAAEPGTLNASLAGQWVNKGILHGAFLKTEQSLSVEAPSHDDVEAAEAWFAALDAKFGVLVRDAHLRLEDMEADPSTVPDRRAAFLDELRGVFALKVEEELDEALHAFDDPDARVEKAVEGLIYYGPLRRDVAEVLGADAEEALHHELEEFVEYARSGDLTEAEHEAAEIKDTLARYRGVDGGDLAARAERFLSSLSLLVAEYDEYVDDGQVVDQHGYEDEVQGLFLPAVDERWAAIQADVAARDAHEAEEIAGLLDELRTQIDDLAPQAQVASTAETIRHEVQAVLGDAAAGAGASLGDADFSALADQLRAQLDQVVEAYRAGDTDRAVALTTGAYLDIYERMEPKVKANAPALNAEIETLINQDLKGQLSAGAPVEDVEATVAAIDGKLITAEKAVAQPVSAEKLLFDSFLIIVREGFEAILIVGAVVAYLRATDNKDKTRYIYAGTAVAIVATLVMWFLVQTVVDLSGADREIIEGVTALLAVVVLFYVSYWLIDKVQIRKWNRFIRRKVGGALQSGNMFALAGVAFLAVFREGLETVLFYQALAGAAGGADLMGSIVMGFLAGLVVLAVLALAFYVYGVKIPLRPMFIVTSALLYYLAFSFMGAGIHELQEAGVVGTTVVASMAQAFAASPGLANTAALFGIYPTVETLFAQGLLVMAALFALVYSFHIEPRLAARKAAVGEMD